MRGVPARWLVTARSKKIEEERLLAECRGMKDSPARSREMQVGLVETITAEIDHTQRVIDAADPHVPERGGRQQIVSLVIPPLTPGDLCRPYALTGPCPQAHIEKEGKYEESSDPPGGAGSYPSVPLGTAPGASGQRDLHWEACWTSVRSTGSPLFTLRRSLARPLLHAISRKSDELNSAKGVPSGPEPYVLQRCVTRTPFIVATIPDAPLRVISASIAERVTFRIALPKRSMCATVARTVLSGVTVGLGSSRRTKSSIGSPTFVASAP